MKPTTPLIIELIAFILISIGINYEVVIGGDIGLFAITGGSVLALYGDMRYRIGKLEGKMELISKSMRVIMNDREDKK